MHASRLSKEHVMDWEESKKIEQVNCITWDSLADAYVAIIEHLCFFKFFSLCLVFLGIFNKLVHNFQVCMMLTEYFHYIFFISMCLT